MLKPLSDRVVLKVIEIEEKTIGGFVIAGNQPEKSNKAEVVAVGPGRCHKGQVEEMTISIGDKVVFDTYAGQEVKDGDETFLIVREKDILAIIE